MKERKTNVFNALIAIIVILFVVVLTLFIFIAKNASKLPDSYVKNAISTGKTDTLSQYESFVSITELDADISEEYGYTEDGDSAINEDFYYEEFPVSVDWEAMDDTYPEVIGWVYFPVLKISAPLVVSDTCTESDTFVAYTEDEADFVEENNVLYFNGGSFNLFAKKKYISNDSTAFVALKSGYDFELCPCVGTSKSSASGAKVTETTWSNLTEKGEWLNSLLEHSDFENVYTWATEDATYVTLVSLEDGVPAYSLVCSLSMF